MSTLSVTVKPRSYNGATGVEGHYQLPNSTSARIARKDGTTVFPNRGSLSSAAKSLATTLGFSFELVENQKKAAKKSVKPAAAKPAVNAVAAKAQSSKAPVAKKTTCTQTSKTAGKSKTPAKNS